MGKDKLNLMNLAFGQGTFKRAIYTSLLVGSLLTFINHGDTIINGGSPAYWKILLTFFVPFCVTVWGAITGKLSN
ncbi:MAG: hypothetical protein CMM39_09620 [Rhodospirillaceae bacterium]|jgi:hypothetical protein|nr:hypothetical protein [Rhodospirillaceae bacterium]